MHTVLAAPHPRHVRYQLATVLEKIQVPPTLLGRVADATELTAFWTLKLAAAIKLQTNFQHLRFTTKFAAAHSPWGSTQAQCRFKEFFRSGSSHPIACHLFSNI